MKLIYIANSRIPTEKAHAIQIMKMCEAFSRSAIDLELILPTRNNPNFKKINSFDYYNIQKIFKIKFLLTFDPYWLIKLPQGIYIKFQILFFIYKLKKYLKKQKINSQTILYTRDEYLLPVLHKFSDKVVLEAHVLPKRIKCYQKYLEKCYKIICISQQLKKELLKQGIKENKILVAHDAVDLQSTINNQQPIIKDLNLSKNEKIIMYTGHLYDWKGAQILADSTKYNIPNTKYIFIGGTQNNIEKFKKENKELIKQNKILVLGYKSPNKISTYLNSADILVLPNSAKDKKSHWTSPLKLFEYMASGKPIVASDLPSIREVLNKENATFFKPDDPQDLAKKIQYILDNPELIEKKTRQAKKDVQNYTWQKRAEKIINFINK